MRLVTRLVIIIILRAVVSTAHPHRRRRSPSVHFQPFSTHTTDHHHVDAFIWHHETGTGQYWINPNRDFAFQLVCVYQVGRSGRCVSAARRQRNLLFTWSVGFFAFRPPVLLPSRRFPSFTDGHCSSSVRRRNHPPSLAFFCRLA